MLRAGKFAKSPMTMLLAGAAAFAYYKYSKMNPQQKKDLVDGLKDKASKFFGQLKGQQNGSTPHHETGV